jgi:hypothetical protein
MLYGGQMIAMKPVLVCMTLGLALVGGLADARPACARPKNCGLVEIRFVGSVVRAEPGARQVFAKVSLRNGMCKPMAIVPHGDPKTGLWFHDDQFVRWESRQPGSDQWIAHIGYSHQGRPGLSGPPLRSLEAGETMELYLEIPPYLRDGEGAPEVRVFITDTEGWSRSSNVFHLTESLKKPVEDSGLDFTDE